jgi:signal transduction histidine kinase
MSAETPLVRRLLEVVDAMGGELDTGPLLEQLSQSALELFEAAGAAWCRLDGDVVTIVTAAGLSSDLRGVTFPLERSALGALLTTGARSLVDRAAHFPHLNDRIYGSEDDRVAVALTSVGGRVTGALYVTLLPEDVFGADELEVLELLASHVGVALHHAALFEEAEHARQAAAAVVAGMADGVAVVARDGTVRSWNRAMERLTGRTAQQSVGRPLPFPLPDEGEVLTSRPAPGRWVDVVVSPAGPEGQRVVSARDVTAAKELEEAQELFLAATSHELRTPLTVLRGFGETLLRHWDVLPDDQRRELAERMLSRTEGMTELVEQILQASAAGLSVGLPAPEVFDLAEVVAAAGRVLSGASDRHEVLVTTAGPVPALGRPESVQTVLDQLVENAVKYSPGGGPIEVAVSAEPGAAVLTVADRGRGISATELERVFERFVRDAAVDGPPGVGLGLWIVRRTVEAQGGSATASPRAGGGTIVCVRLPRPPA